MKIRILCPLRTRSFQFTLWGRTALIELAVYRFLESHKTCSFLCGVNLNFSLPDEIVQGNLGCNTRCFKVRILFRSDSISGVHRQRSYTRVWQELPWHR